MQGGTGRSQSLRWDLSAWCTSGQGGGEGASHASRCCCCLLAPAFVVNSSIPLGDAPGDMVTSMGCVRSGLLGRPPSRTAWQVAASGRALRGAGRATCSSLGARAGPGRRLTADSGCSGLRLLQTFSPERIASCHFKEKD